MRSVRSAVECGSDWDTPGHVTASVKKYQGKEADGFRVPAVLGRNHTIAESTAHTPKVAATQFLGSGVGRSQGERRPTDNENNKCESEACLKRNRGCTTPLLLIDLVFLVLRLNVNSAKYFH
jgi:hypothetical protein